MSSPGLRERKKLKTRWAIQEHAMRLFAKQGYDATTVDQIAAAAEISPSTFFRYFRTKEDVVILDEYDDLLEEGLQHLDTSVPPLTAVRTVMTSALSTMDADANAALVTRTRLIMSTPALRARSLENFRSTLEYLSRGIAARTGRDVDELEVRAFVGAVVGALMSVIDVWVDRGGTEPLADLLDRTLAYLESGLTLTPREADPA